MRLVQCSTSQITVDYPPTTARAVQNSIDFDRLCNFPYEHYPRVLDSGVGEEPQRGSGVSQYGNLIKPQFPIAKEHAISYHRQDEPVVAEAIRPIRAIWLSGVRAVGHRADNRKKKRESPYGNIKCPGGLPGLVPAWIFTLGTLPAGAPPIQFFSCALRYQLPV